ncbi:MAG: HAD-IIA family hydrolase [Chloroflexi bacterium]|nr:HAD-IIA family hydrolase [Chloroflexota bacterium]
MVQHRNIRNLIIDMDGVLWHGDKPLPGLNVFFDTLRGKEIKFILATNNSSKTAEEYVSKLKTMGVIVYESEILTAAQATADYLKQKNKSGKVFVIGEKGLRQALEKHGFILSDLYETNVQFVVCGMDRSITWDKLATATLNIRAGASFIGTNPDPTFPIEKGIVHGNGAILAAIEVATGIAPLIIGKPEPYMYLQALSCLGNDVNSTVALGDRLDTDILGAVNAGIRSILVLTGISKQDHLSTVGYKPTWIMKDLPEISDFIRNM